MVGLLGCIENSGFAEVHQVDKAQARAHEVQIPASHTNPDWRLAQSQARFLAQFIDPEQLRQQSRECIKLRARCNDHRRGAA